MVYKDYLANMEKMVRDIERKVIEQTIKDYLTNLNISIKKKNSKEIIFDNKHFPRFDKNMKKLMKIAYIVLEAEFGISVIDIARKIKIDRSNLVKFIEILEDKEIILRSKKQGSYIIHPQLIQRSKHHQLIEIFLEKIIPNMRSLNIDDIEHEKILTDLDRNLYSFINRMGVCITFILLSIINKNNNLIDDNIEYEYKDKNEKYHMKIKFLYDLISKLSVMWLAEFRYDVYRLSLGGKSNVIGKKESSIPQSFRKERIHNLIINNKDIETGFLDQSIVEQYLKSFEKIYPMPFWDWRGIKSDIQDEISEIKQEDDYLKYQRKFASTCNHVFEIPENFLKQSHTVVGGSKKIKHKHCRKCHSTRYIY